MRQLLKTCYLALVGGVLYAVVETIWRGSTHWTMVPVGGLCFVSVLVVNGVMPERAGLLLRCAAGAAAVTAIEFVSGAVLNLWLGMGIWDYSSMPMNLLGQVCLPFSLGWAVLSAPALLIGRFLDGLISGPEPGKGAYSVIRRHGTRQRGKVEPP